MSYSPELRSGELEGCWRDALWSTLESSYYADLLLQDNRGRKGSQTFIGERNIYFNATFRLVT